MKFNTQLLKDNGGSNHSSQSLVDWNLFLTNIREYQLKGFTDNGIYELAIQHGIACKCCSRIVRLSSTHPTNKELEDKSHRPGRPRLRKRG